MSTKHIPFSHATVTEILKQYPTPFHIYDERAIRENLHALYNAFSWVHDEQGNKNGFKNYFAVKALPNPHILPMLKRLNVGVDCSSMAELVLAERCNLKGADIFFTANNTPIEEFKKANALNAYLNLDDINYLDYLKRYMRLPQWISFRYNPGSLRTGNTIIGAPEQSKFGITREQILMAYPLAQKYGVEHFGLHTMITSNELRNDYFIETAHMLFDLVHELYATCNIRIELINLGGGMGIPYLPNQSPLDYNYIARGIQQAYQEKIVAHNLGPIRIVTENGRIITGPYGYLVSTVRHVKKSYKNFIGLDATMANLMRPALYGAYHHISILGKDGETVKYDVTGSLCENNDKFAIDRMLPPVVAGDIAIIHDTGAHGAAMGFNYNGKLRCAELLLRSDGAVQQIRNAETLANYFATLDFESLE